MQLSRLEFLDTVVSQNFVVASLNPESRYIFLLRNT